MITVKNLTKKRLIARRVRMAKNFLERMRGLLGTKTLDKDEGLWIPGCQGVHTFGMGYSLDVVYLDDTMTVIGLALELKPNLAGPIFWRAKSVLEFPAGTVGESGIQIGDKLLLEKVGDEKKLTGVTRQCLS